jgi:hypothetical protein
VWDPQADAPWALLTDLPPSQRNLAWYALRMWDAEEDYYISQIDKNGK